MSVPRLPSLALRRLRAGILTRLAQAPAKRASGFVLYFHHMTAKQRTTLQARYTKFRKTKRSKRSLLSLFRTLMPELIFRTTKLEGEKVTRKSVHALF